MVKQLLLFFVFGLLFFQTLHAYPPGNTRLPYDAELAEADRYFKKATEMFDAGKYDSTIFYSEKARRLYFDLEKWGNYADTYNKTGAAYERLSKHNKARVCYDSVLSVSKRKLGELHPATAACYNNIGVNYSYLGDVQKELMYFEKALDINLKIFKSDTAPELVFNYCNIGLTHRKLGNFDKALEYLEKGKAIIQNVDHQKALLPQIHMAIGFVYSTKGEYSRDITELEHALRLQLELTDEPNPTLAVIYSNLGVNYQTMGFYDKSVDLHEKSLKIRLKAFGEKHLHVAMSYENLAGVYEDKRKFDKVIPYAKKALAIKLALFGSSNPEVAKSYRGIGKYYGEQRDYKNAIIYSNKSLALFSSLFGSTHYEAANCLNNLAECYGRLGDIQKEHELLKRAIEIMEKTLGRNHTTLGSAYNNLGVLYGKINEHNKELTYLKKAFRIRISNFGKSHPRVAMSYLNIGSAFYKMNRFDSASFYFEKALYAITTGNADLICHGKVPNRKNIRSVTVLFEILKYKGEFHFERFISDRKKLSELQLAYNTFSAVAKLDDSLKNKSTVRISTYDSRNFLSEIYQGAIRSCEEMYQITADKSYLNKAFTLTEKNKASALLHSLRDSEAKQFAGISDSLIAAEHNLKVDIAFYEKQIFSAEQKKDSAKVSMYQNYLFDKKIAFEKLIKQLESEFPDYYRLKYDTKVASVKEIQKFLPEKTQLINYFVGDSALYIFDISKTDYQLHKIIKPDGFEDSIYNFRKSLTASGFSAFVKGDKLKKKALFKQWITQNKFLSELLLKPVLDSADNHLIIIPDGVLGYLPFETLLTTTFDETKTDFSKLPYLIRSHAVSYAYSATLLLENDPKKEVRKDVKPFAGFAPHYANQITQVEDTLRNDLTALLLRNGLTSLKFNTNEVNSAAGLLKGTAFVGNNASKQVFQKEAQNYRILHLAGHTVIDDENPMYSGLIFTKTTDSLSNHLEASELYNMKLNARLAVLSACETGYGKLVRGEGVMSLSRAFSYAGVPSLLMSLWKVDDKTTADLMTDFYTQLDQGKGIDQAARSTKINYLTKTTHPVYSHPFFWAAFVPVGDMKPIQMDKNNVFIWWIAGILVLIIGAACFSIIRMRK